MKIVSMFVCLMLMFCVVGIAEVSPEPQNFKVTYVITYNSITLAEASDLEERIKGNHADACGVKTKVSAGESGSVNFVDSSTFHIAT